MKFNSYLFILIFMGGQLMADDNRIQNSPNFKDGKFFNAKPVVEAPFFTMLSEWIKGAENTIPKIDLPVNKLFPKHFTTPPQTGLRITWLGHSSFIIELENLRILVDPVWGEKVSPVSFYGPERFFPPLISIADLPKIDLVLISHNHYDHLDEFTIKALLKKDKDIKYILPLGVGSTLRDWGVNPKQIQELDWWENFRYQRITITSTPARHFSGRSVFFTDRDKTLWMGFAIAGSTQKVYYSGDTGMFDGFKKIGERLGPFDVSLFEIGAYNKMWSDVHLGPEQAIKAFKMIRGGIFIPVHWALFDLALHSWTEPVERLIKEAKLKKADIFIPKPGESMEPALSNTFEKWWPTLPWQTKEEHPIRSTGL